VSDLKAVGGEFPIVPQGRLNELALVVDHGMEIGACPVEQAMTEVSMCHISSARVVRSPILGVAERTRRRGRPQS
jgi:hypothetical protein